MSTTNDRLTLLLRKYQATTKTHKQQTIIDDICFEKKQISDFEMLLDHAKQFNFDLNFVKSIIDNFFEWQFDAKALITFYKKVKGKVFENYFVGNIYRKNLSFKSLEYFYSETESQKELSKIILQVMLSSSLSIENFLSLLCCNGLDPVLEQQLLAEIRRRNACMDFWVKALERAKPKSALYIYTENLLRQLTEKRPFTSAYKFYMENCESKAAPILLKTIATMAKSEEELNIILYVAPQNSRIYHDSKKRKEDLEPE